MHHAENFGIFHSLIPPQLRDFLLTQRMSSIIEEITQFLTPQLESIDCYLIEARIRGEKSSKIVEIFIDSDQGASIEKCSRISREVSQFLDNSDLIPGRYRLDVSSPGLDRSLSHPRQFTKNIGRHCKVRYAQNGQQMDITGILQDAKDDSIEVMYQNSVVTILKKDITEILIIPKLK